MKKLCLLLALCVFLSGCASPVSLENQSHAISIGIDAVDGGIRLSVQVPTIGGESSESKEKSVSVSYSIYSATAKTFPEVYDLLFATLPERLNLTQLKTVIISEELARSSLFLPLMEQLFRVYALSAAATVIVSRSSALQMLENQKAFIGTHLSISMPAMLDNYAQTGYIPLVSLSDLFACLKGVYATGKAALGSTAEKSAPDDRYTAGRLNRTGSNPNEYMGCALFDRTHMVCVLNGRETQLMRLLEGDRITVDSMPGYPGLSLHSDGSVRVDVDIRKEPVEITVNMKLHVSSLTDGQDIRSAEHSLSESLTELVCKCQALGVEPFGLAGYACTGFRTMQDWQDFNWTDRFSRARVQISVQLTD